MKRRKKKKIIINFWLFIIGIILLPFNAIINVKNNKTSVDKGKRDLQRESKLLIEKIKKYIKNNYLEQADILELNEQIKYLEFVNKKGIDYLIKKNKEKLEFKFFCIKNKIHTRKPSNNNKNIKEKVIKNDKRKKELSDIKIKVINNENKSIESNKEKKRRKNYSNLDLEKKKKKNIKFLKINPNIFKEQKKLKVIYKNNYKKIKTINKKTNYNINNSNFKQNKNKINKEIKIITDFYFKNNNLNNNYLSNKTIENKHYEKKGEERKNFQWNQKYKFVNSIILNRKKSKKNVFARFTNSQYKEVINLNIKFRNILKDSLNKANNIYTAVLVSVKILNIKNNFFAGKKIDFQKSYNKAINNPVFANHLIDNAITCLDDILKYLDINISQKNKNSYVFKKLTEYIITIKNNLISLSKDIYYKSNSKILKKDYF